MTSLLRILRFAPQLHRLYLGIAVYIAITVWALRMQTERPVVDGVKRPNRSLADFIAPQGSGVPDYIGAFVVTAGIGEETITMRFKKAKWL